MKTLAIDTSTRQGSLALFQGDELIAAQWLDSSLPTTQVITPALKQLVEEAGWKPGDLELVAVSQGPGSFTGLRIGVITAKTIAYVASAATIGVNTLGAIAARCSENVSRLHVVMDAQRNELFHGLYQRDDSGVYRELSETRILDRDAFLETLVPGESITGPGLKNRHQQVPEGVRVVDESYWMPSAEAVGRIAIAQFRAGISHDFWKLNPNYYRKSAAEEKLEAS